MEGILRATGGALIAAALVSLTSSCKSGDCRESATCTGPLEDGGAGAEAGPAVSSGAFEFEAFGPQRVVMHDTIMRFTVFVKREPTQNENIVVTVADLPLGVTVDPLTIQGSQSSGELVIRVNAQAKQGPFVAKVVGAASKASASAPLEIFVRGKPGTVDTTFGTEGRALAVLGAGRGAPSGELLVGAQDQIFVTGRMGNNAGAVARLTVDGQVDSTYGTGGVTDVPLSPLSAVLDSLGRVVIAGAGLVARLLTSGLQDLTFAADDGGNRGVTKIYPYGGGTMLSIDGDAIYAVISTTGKVVKLDATGKRVSQFASASITWAADTTTAIVSITAQKGHVTVAGSYFNLNGSTPPYGFGIAQLDGITGALNTSYSGDGLQAFERPERVTSNQNVLLTLADGRLLYAPRAIAGSSYLAMISGSGETLDSTFGSAGLVSLPLADGARGLALQADGRFLAAIGAGLIRMGAKGAVDSSFGDGGTFTSSTVGDSAQRVAVQSDGRILLLCDASDNSVNVTRIWN
jgi:hypothetical protein